MYYLKYCVSLRGRLHNAVLSCTVCGLIVVCTDRAGNYHHLQVQRADELICEVEPCEKEASAYVQVASYIIQTARNSIAATEYVHHSSEPVQLQFGNSCS